MKEINEEEIVVENKFSPSELHLILNRLGQASFNAEHKDAVGRCLARKKAKGIPIDDKAIAICIAENKPKKSKMSKIGVSPTNRVSVSLNNNKRSK